jgi:leader peptidase (prepilin peptidase)/N-methyltransferase
VALALLIAALAWLLRDVSVAQWSQGLLLTCLLYVLAIVDLHTLHVPLPLVFAGIGVRLMYLALLERPALLPMLLGLFAGAGMLTLAALAYETVRGRMGLGQGDAAVLGLIGAFVGWQGLLPALLGAALAGLIGGGTVLLAMRKPLDTPLPFAPFLAAGGWAVFAAQAAGWLQV